VPVLCQKVGGADAVQVGKAVSEGPGDLPVGVALVQDVGGEGHESGACELNVVYQAAVSTLLLLLLLFIRNRFRASSSTDAVSSVLCSIHSANAFCH